MPEVGLTDTDVVGFTDAVGLTDTDVVGFTDAVGLTDGLTDGLIDGIVTTLGAQVPPPNGTTSSHELSEISNAA